MKTSIITYKDGKQPSTKAPGSIDSLIEETNKSRAQKTSLANQLKFAIDQDGNVSKQTRSGTPEIQARLWELCT